MKTLLTRRRMGSVGVISIVVLAGYLILIAAALIRQPQSHEISGWQKRPR